MRGIGIGVDFYSEAYLWSYIGAFLVLRVLALVVSVLMVVFKLGSHQGGIGRVAVNWLCLSWISTVILGVPISKAVFKSDVVGLKYGIFAGISRYARFKEQTCWLWVFGNHLIFRLWCLSALFSSFPFSCLSSNATSSKKNTWSLFLLENTSTP